MSFRTAIVLTLLIPWSFFLGQTRGKPTARELFYAKTAPRAQAPAAVAAKKNLGLRYSVQKEINNVFLEVSADTVFRTGDHIRIAVEASDSGYLYIVQQGASGKWGVLFPTDQINNGANRVEKGVRISLPPDTHFNFKEPAGSEKLFIVLSGEPLADWDKLIYSVGRGQATKLRPVQIASVDEAFVKRLDQGLTSRDLVYEKSARADDTAVYVVKEAVQAGGRLEAELILKHQ